MSSFQPYAFETYDEARRNFSWDKYRNLCDWDPSESINIAHECVDRHATKRGAVAFYWIGKDFETKTVTFWEFSRESGRFANFLEELGVPPGSRIFTYLPRIPETYYAMLGTFKFGGIFGAINERYGPDGIRHRLSDSGASVVLTTPDHRDVIRSVSREVESVDHVVIIDREDRGSYDDEHDYMEARDQLSTEYETFVSGPDDPAVIFYTSGTTGPAKGVVHGHSFAYGNVGWADLPMCLEPDDLAWITADPGWGTGYFPLAVWFAAQPVVIYEGEFDPGRWARILEEYPITKLHSVPTAYRMLQNHQDVLQDRDIRLRSLSSVGEPLNPSVIQWSQETFGEPIRDTYGTSETYGSVISNYPFMKVKPGSMGRAHPGVSVKICEPGTLEEVDQGETGEIYLDRDYPNCFLRYWDRPDQTEAKIKDGWVRTNDLARQDDDGYFWFEGRADDVILSAGYRIGPFDIESTLMEHDAVAEAAVVGKPHEERGEIVKAFIVPSETASTSSEVAEDIQSYVKERHAAHEYPREINFRETLPKTTTGKIRRTELRDQG